MSGTGAGGVSGVKHELPICRRTVREACEGRYAAALRRGPERLGES